MRSSLASREWQRRGRPATKWSQFAWEKEHRICTSVSVVVATLCFSRRDLTYGRPTVLPGWRSFSSFSSVLFLFLLLLFSSLLLCVLLEWIVVVGWKKRRTAAADTNNRQSRRVQQPSSAEKGQRWRRMKELLIRCIRWRLWSYKRFSEALADLPIWCGVSWAFILLLVVSCFLVMSLVRLTAGHCHCYQQIILSGNYHHCHKANLLKFKLGLDISCTNKMK